MFYIIISALTRTLPYLNINF